MLSRNRAKTSGKYLQKIARSNPHGSFDGGPKSIGATYEHMYFRIFIIVYADHRIVLQIESREDQPGDDIRRLIPQRD